MTLNVISGTQYPPTHSLISLRHIHSSSCLAPIANIYSARVGGCANYNETTLSAAPLLMIHLIIIHPPPSSGCEDGDNDDDDDGDMMGNC